MLVAEGSALVMAILQTGKIDAIVGVSCLSVLEKAFPYVESAAIPGVAIPLLQSDCKDVTVDLDWIWEVIHLTSEDRTYRLSLDSVREQVADWFTPAALDNLFGPACGETERIARQWLAGGGKRWRPFLAACVWRALQAETDQEFPSDLRRLAVAVECFHKASLIHDDIEDNDHLRYGEPTLHESHGVPVALNVGDFLLGEGYRLIGFCDVPAEDRVAMLQAAATGHRALCMGQGAELTWSRSPRPLRPPRFWRFFNRRLPRLSRSPSAWGRPMRAPTRIWTTLSAATARPWALLIRSATTWKMLREKPTILPRCGPRCRWRCCPSASRPTPAYGYGRACSTRCGAARPRAANGRAWRRCWTNTA